MRRSFRLHPGIRSACPDASVVTRGGGGMGSIVPRPRSANWRTWSATRSIATGWLILYGTFLHGISQAAMLQLMSVKEDSPGAVTATVSVHADVTPNAADFQLLFDGKNDVKATEVKPASSSLLETSVILCIDQSGSM